MEIKTYQYKESGLDNIFVNGLHTEDDAGEQYVTIPAVGYLHMLIAKQIVNKSSCLLGNEVYFLRGEMGMSCETLATKIGLKKQDIIDWESKKVTFQK